MSKSTPSNPCRVLLLLLALVGLMGVTAPAAGAVGTTDFTGDVTPPALQSLALSPASVDDTNSQVWVYFTAHITDDYSGVDQSRSEVTVESPSGMSYSCMGCGFQLGSGTATDGYFQAKAEIPQGATPGTWTLLVALYDNAGNQKIWTNSDLQAAGFPYQFTVTNTGGDSTGPSLAGLQIGTPTVDVSGGSGVFDVRIHATDAGSGVRAVSAFLVDPMQTDGGSYPESPDGSATLSSGSGGDGWWDFKVVIPAHTHAGTWTVGVDLLDASGNSVRFQPATISGDGYPDSFQVNSPEPDNDAPGLVSFSMSPAEVDVHDSAQTVTVRAHITDNMTGTMLSGLQTTMQSPIRHQVDWAGPWQLVSGTATDGVYEAPVTVPRAAETGAWPIGVAMNDMVSNSATYGLWGGPSLATVGALPYEVVYNVPLPPLDIQVSPGDGSALVQWKPGSDEGSPITQFTVTESPQGISTTVDASRTSVVMTGLENGVNHTFTVGAVNKAGPSTPSAAASTVPEPGLGQPSPSTATNSGGTSSTGATSPGTSSTGTASGASSSGGTASTATSGPGPSGNAASGADGPPPVRYGVLGTDGSWRDVGGGTYSLASRPVVPVAAGAADPVGTGGWAVAGDGGVFTFGDARFFGSTGSLHLAQPIVGMAATPDAAGYWLVARDGGIFTFGDARFFGSTGSLQLAQPIVGMAATPDGAGYWLVARDGGIFTFGDARFFGSTGGRPLSAPVTGLATSPDGAGYWLVTTTGYVYGFGDAGYTGSTGTATGVVCLARS